MIIALGNVELVGFEIIIYKRHEQVNEFNYFLSVKKG